MDFRRKWVNVLDAKYGRTDEKYAQMVGYLRYFSFLTSYWLPPCVFLTTLLSLLCALCQLPCKLFGRMGRPVRDPGGSVKTRPGGVRQVLAALRRMR